jgi:N6-adenosine-specific RNA methylase IME4
MSLADLAELPIRDLAERDAHLYVWTTNAHVRETYWLSESWGFTPICTLVWCKEPRGFGPGGTFQSNVEFIIFARRGSLAAKTKVTSRWHRWPRSAHSAKPDAFLDMVETVSPGPYLELFARRNRLGWDTWGDECLQHVEMTA